METYRIAAAGAALVLAVSLAACGGGTASNPPAASSAAASAPAASSPAASAPAASSPVASSSGTAAVCAEAQGPGDVSANAKGFAFDPATVQVKVGQKVTWTNGDSAPHTVTLDGGQCTTAQFQGGASATLVFNVAGSYPFHCQVHPTMKGTIVVS